MKLTHSKPGSVQQLLKISFPLMLSSLSYVLMLFFDRLLLARYSINALNAVVVSGTFSWILIEPFRILAGMVEVFVAQYNGANKKQKIARPVWQAIWFSLGFSLFCLICAFWVLPFIFNDPMEKTYSFLLLIFSFAPILVSALSAFYIGRGYTLLIVLLSFVGNIINLILDIILIFGIDGLVPAMGVKGAAIATNIGFLTQLLILSVLFLSKKNRRCYNTSNFRIDFSLLKRCLQVGSPIAFNVFVEIMAIYLFYKMMSSISIQHITVASIWHTVIVMFYFVGEGMNQGVSIVAGNFIGAKQYCLISRIIKSGLKIYSIPLILIVLLLVFYPDFFINLFLKSGDKIVYKGIMLSVENISSDIRSSLKWCFILECFVLALIWIRMLIGGILNAAGDTLFQLLVESFLIIFCFLLPVYLLVLKTSAKVEIVSLILVIESFLAACIFYYRYRKKVWERIELVKL